MKQVERLGRPAPRQFLHRRDGLGVPLQVGEYDGAAGAEAVAVFPVVQRQGAVPILQGRAVVGQLHVGRRPIPVQRDEEGPRLVVLRLLAEQVIQITLRLRVPRQGRLGLAVLRSWNARL